jgi:hypothetical protein
MMRSNRCILVLLSLGLLAIYGSMGFGGVVRMADEPLDPPTRLSYATPLRDVMRCTDCMRGPYILDTDQKGTTPQDLTELVVELRSAIDSDLALVILTQYVWQGEFRWRDEWEVCISDRDIGGNFGHERCEITTESRLQQIRGRPIYIFVYNLGRPDHEFTLTAQWEPHVLPTCSKEPCFPLSNNESESLVVEANGFRFVPAGKQEQYRLLTFEVPSGAMVLALRVRSSDPANRNVDVFLGWNPLQPEEKPEEKANMALVSSLGEEAMILPQPTSGRYWIAVLNRSSDPQTVEVIVAAVMDLATLGFGTPATGQIGATTGLLPLIAQYLSGAGGTFAGTQYLLELKPADLQGVLGVRITLQGPNGPNLYLRFEKIVEIRAGQVLADLSLIGPAPEKTLVLSGALLKPAKIYLAVQAIGPLPQEYTLEVSLIKAGVLGSQLIQVPLTPVAAHLTGR